MREYRASSLGYSLEALVCPHLGYSPIPPPQWLQEKYDEGKRLEPIVVEKLREVLPANTRIIYLNTGSSDDGREGEEVRLEVIPGIATIVGHIDARAVNGVGEKVVEIKTMSDRTWQAFYNAGLEAKGHPLLEKYQWQISTYMLATGLPCMVVGFNKESGEIARVTITEPPKLMSDIAARISKAENHIRLGTIPDGCEDYPCAYFYLHAPKEEAESADETVDNLLAQWLAADKAEKTYKREKDNLKAEIVKLAGEKASKVRGSQGVTVSTYWQKEAPVTGYMKKAQWVTSISAPRAKKDGDSNAEL